MNITKLQTNIEVLFQISKLKSRFNGIKKYFHRSESELLKKLEEEHEQLNSSLLALTTHFAQVRDNQMVK